MLSSFGKFSDKDNDEATVNVTVPQISVNDLNLDNKILVNLSEPQIIIEDKCFNASFKANNKEYKVLLNFTQKKRITVGRGK